MPDSSEFAALEASLRGALSTAKSLASIAERLRALKPGTDIPPTDLEDLARLAAAHATAAAALRSLVETLKRRISNA